MATLKIKQAVKGNNTFDLSGQHITTTDFGIPSVTNIWECVPKDHFSINVFGECRLAPMPVPTYMDVKLVTRAFFVPMHSVWRYWEDFIRQTKDTSVSTYVQLFPSILNKAIVQEFANNRSLSTYQPISSDNLPFDFRIDTGSAIVTAGLYTFTDTGRWLYKLLLSLGYSVNFSESDNTSQSALPLLAYVRVCYDYLYPAQYVESLALASQFEQSFSFGNLVSKLLQLRNLPFRQDYFTAAWKDIQQPGAYYQDPTFDVIGANGDGVQGQASQTVLLHQTSQSNLVQLSQQGLQLLQRAYEFITRNNIAGSRYVDRLLAAFGVGSHKFDSQRSVFLESFEQDVQIVDVTATSSNESQFLGELAGKGFSQKNSGKFVSFSIPEQLYGYILVLSHVEPRINYYQGRKLHTLHKSRFDFYTPEFDMQMRAIRNDELFADYKDDVSYSNGQQYGGQPNGVFGFAPRYSEYKKGESYLTGDFRLPTLNTGLDSYHLFRVLDTPSQSNPLSLSPDFLFAHPHEFDRIFSQPMVSLYGLHYAMNNDLYPLDQILYVGEYPALFKDPNTNPNDFYLLVKKDSHFYKISSNGSLPSGYSTRDFRIFEFPNGYANFTMFGVSIPFSIPTGQSIPDGIALSHDELLRLFSRYIDHFYIRWIFNVQASRPMVRISDEFMIEDGGEEKSISMNGNELN